MKQARDLIAAVYRQGGDPNEVDQDLVFAFWEEVVGRRVAMWARPLRLSEGRLYVGVESPEWLAELEPLRYEIRTQLNLAVGKSVVKDIRLGPVAGKRMPPGRERTAAPEASLHDDVARRRAN